jgi:O-antigen ligase/tetratricopeptide (TPR) repeat protein
MKTPHPRVLSRGAIRSACAPASSPLADDFEKSNLRATLVGLIALKIVGIILIVDPLGLQAFNLPKTLFSHFSAWVLLGVLAASLLRYGPGIVPRAGIHLAVAGFVIASIAAAITAEDRYVALFGAQDSYLGLSFLADMVILYAATAVALRGVRDLALVASAAMGASLVAAAYAGIQYAGLDPIVWKVDPGLLRPFSTFGNPDQFGQFLSLSFGASLGVALCAKRRLLAIVGGIFCVLFVVLAAIVATRGTLIGIAAAVGAGVILYVRLRRPPVRVILMGVLGTFVVIGLFTPIAAATPLGQRALGGVEEASAGRLRIYAAAFLAFESRPVVGYGPDSFGVVYPRFGTPERRERFSDRQVSAHSWLLQTVVTTGIVGLVALLALLTVFVRAAWRSGIERAAVVVVPLMLASGAYWAHGMVGVGSITIDWLPWFTFGAVAAVTGRREPVVSPARARSARLALAGAAFVATAAVAAFGVNAFGANRDAQLARTAWTAGAMSVAGDAAASATQRDPGRAEYWNWLGLAREGEGDLERAEASYAAAATRAPYESTYWINLALIRARAIVASGASPLDGAAALAAAERAVLADPRDWRAIGVLAEVADLFGPPEVAFRSAVRSILLNAGLEDFQLAFRGERRQEEIAASAALKLADASEARHALDEAVAAHDSATLRVALAQLALRTNDLNAARADAQRALQLDPENADARRILATTGP